MAATWFGFNPPFLGGAQNVLSRQTDDRLIKNDLLQLLLTVPGERVYRPDFGTLLRAYTFEQFDEDGGAGLASHIRQQIERHEERVVVNSVQIAPAEDAHLLRVAVSVSPVNQPLINYLIEVQTGGNRGGRA